MPKDKVVIYHARCTDGFTAAWVCWLAFGESAEYVPAHYGDTPPDVTGKDVYIVDFSYPLNVMIELSRYAKKITTFDHHKTAAKDLQAFPDKAQCVTYTYFDMYRSGAGIAWDELRRPLARPWIVDYVEDRDLWRFKLPASQAVNEYLHIAPKTFARWTDMASMAWTEFGHRGVTLLEGREAYIREHSEMVRLDGYLYHTSGTAESSYISPEIPIINNTHAMSDLIGHLAEGHPFAVGWFQRADGMYVYSLRSRGENGADVSEIAKVFGGGGHKNAAGFTVKERVDR